MLVQELASYGKAFDHMPLKGQLLQVQITPYRLRDTVPDRRNTERHPGDAEEAHRAEDAIWCNHPAGLRDGGSVDGHEPLGHPVAGVVLRGRGRSTHPRRCRGRPETGPCRGLDDAGWRLGDVSPGP